MYNYNFNNDEWFNRLVRNNNSNSSSSSLFTPEEGYNKGNLFRNLYNQYKNYQPINLKGSNEQERMLLELNRIGFAKHELNLYLDVYPDDVSMIRLFNDYRVNENKLRDAYENKYGPIELDTDSLNASPFMWLSNGFPWEAKNNV